MNLKNQTISGLTAVLPALQELATAFIELTKSDSGTREFFTYLGEAARLVSQSVVVSFFAVTDVIDRTVTTIKEAKLELKGLVGADTEADQAEYGRLKREFANRVSARDRAEKAFLKNTTQNSIFFGSGTTDEIKKRQQEATRVQASNRAAAAPNLDNGENAKILRTFDEKIGKMRAEAAALGDSNAKRQAAVLIAELEAKGISRTSSAYLLYSQRLTQAATALEAAKEKQTSSDLLRKETQAAELQRIQIQNYGLQQSELDKLVAAKDLDNQASQATIRFTEEGRAAYLEATESIKAQRLALIDQQQAQKQSFGVGAQSALREYLDAARDVASQTKAAFSQAFQNMEDSLVDFVKTGKLNFQKFADDIVDQIIRITVRSAALQAITGTSSLFGSVFGGGAAAASSSVVASSAGNYAGALGTFQFANGGIMSSAGPLPLRTYSAGGVARSPQLALYGEAGPEAYVPLPDGRSIPVSMKGAGAGTNVSVVVNMDGGGDQASSDTDKGRQLGQLVASAVKNELIQQRRAGGLLA